MFLSYELDTWDKFPVCWFIPILLYKQKRLYFILFVDFTGERKSQSRIDIFFRTKLIYSLCPRRENQIHSIQSSMWVNLDLLKVNYFTNLLVIWKIQSLQLVYQRNIWIKGNDDSYDIHKLYLKKTEMEAEPSCWHFPFNFVKSKDWIKYNETWTTSIRVNG